MMNTIDRDWLLSLLREGDVKVTFTKTDGTQREMLCTLKEGVVVPHEKKTDRVKKVNEDVIPVWDIENEGWRSFKLSAVTGIDVTAGEKQ